MNVHHRNAYRHAVNLTFVRDFDLVFTKRNVGRRSTHVERDELRVTTNLAYVKRADNTTCRTGKNGSNRRVRRGERLHRPAVGLHHAEIVGALCERTGAVIDRPYSSHSPLQPEKIATHDWRKISVDDGRRCSFVLPVFRQDAG